MRRSIWVAAGLSLALAGTAGAQSSTIQGTVTATPAKYLPDTVVYLKSVPGSYTPKTLTVDQKGMKFIPRVLTATAGDTVEFTNHDNVNHDVMSPDNGGYDLGAIKPDGKASKKFDKPGTYTQLCNLHPEMLGYLFVGQNPYSAVVDASGAFTIPNVPAGTYEVEVWNPKLKAAPQKVTVSAGAPAQVSFALKR